MSASSMPSLTLSGNRQYLASPLEEVNRDFGHTYSAVKRNHDRFPEDFMFQLNKRELENWRSQIVTSNPAAKMGLRRPPYAFTEHGVAMLSAVLHSDRAVQMSILIVRAFVKFREMLATHKDLARKMEEPERQQKEHGCQLAAVYSIVKKLIDVPAKPQNPIGFRADK